MNKFILLLLVSMPYMRGSEFRGFSFKDSRVKLEDYLKIVNHAIVNKKRAVLLHAADLIARKYENAISLKDQYDADQQLHDAVDKISILNLPIVLRLVEASDQCPVFDMQDRRRCAVLKLQVLHKYYLDKDETMRDVACAVPVVCTGAGACSLVLCPSAAYCSLGAATASFFCVSGLMFSGFDFNEYSKIDTCSRKDVDTLLRKYPQIVQQPIAVLEEGAIISREEAYCLYDIYNTGFWTEKDTVKANKYLQLLSNDPMKRD